MVVVSPSLVVDDDASTILVVGEHTSQLFDVMAMPERDDGGLTNPDALCQDFMANDMRIGWIGILFIMCYRSCL